MKLRSSLWLIAAAFLPPAQADAKTCKCLSYQSCWPSASEFEQLSSQLSQPLIRPVPPASACYPPSADNCTETESNFDNGGWRSDLPGAMQAIFETFTSENGTTDARSSTCGLPSEPSGNCNEAVSHLVDGASRSNLPGAMQSTNFESFTLEDGTINACYYNVTLGSPCEQGNIPTIGVDVRSVGDIQATVRFSAKHNLKLVIKNTGHDFLGRSAGRGALMLWTHNLKHISYNDDFVPEGAPDSAQSYKALTFEAGVQWFEAYAAASNAGRAIVGGQSNGASVGAAGGWVLGGGHGVLSPTYGLGVDNAIQFTVVLASGDYVTANAYKNEDLFWALRGGGGGTYGVVVTVTYRTHDPLPSTVISFSVKLATPEIAQNVTTDYFSTLVALSDAGLGGYSLLSTSGLSALYFGSQESVAKANKTLSSFIASVNSTVSSPHDFTALVSPLPSFDESFSAFYNAFLDLFGTIGLGTPLELYSRFVSRKLVQEEPEKVAKVVLGIPGGIEFNLVAGGAVSRADPESTGLNPAWRESVGHFVGGIGWAEGTSTAEINRLRQGAAANLEALDAISPNSGTYFNEASLYEKDFKKSYFGSHYPRLKAIKRKYDKDDLFLVTAGVGSDDWDKLLNCRLE